ncbi:MAG: S9 family peptidase [Bryobacteraceae bacterium]
MTLSSMQAEAPRAKVVSKEISVHGDTRIDNYFWLREKSNPDVIAYLQAENRYTEAVLKSTEKLQEQLYREIRGRVKETDESVPYRRVRYFYYTRTEEGKQYPIYCRKAESLDAPEQVLLDENELAAGQPYFRIGALAVSPNQELLAYSTDTAGDESYTVFVKNLKTGELLADRVENTYYSLEWANDNETLFYNVIDPVTKRPYKLFRHKLGTQASDDVLVFHEPDEAFTLSLVKTRSREYLILELESATTSEARYLRADEPESEFVVFEPRRHEIEYDLTHHGEHFYFRINDSGKNFRLVRVPVSEPVREKWEEVLPHRAGVLLQSVNPFRRHLVLVEREKGLRRLNIRNLESGESHFVQFPEPAYTVSLAENPEFETTVLRFHYTSLITPPSVFDYDMDTRTRDLKKQTEVLGGYDPSRYQSERIFATAPDGTKIPMSLVYRKGLALDGRNPTLLYGYGAYGITIEPSFSSERLSLIDRGFVYAIAHIRGGSDLGKLWHESGRMLHKTNSFTDFIACAEHLIAAKYTSKDRLAVMGGSAGGLLMGAVVNLRPDLFHAVIAKVPFVDVLNTMLDASLPLTVGEYEEWGDPNEKPYYDYIKSYSPYDNVQKKAYPHMLVTAGLNDPRVSYWEPAKWVARLRAVKQDENLLLLKTNMGAGHFGASGRYERMKETAFDYAFLLHVMGMAAEPAAAP